MRLLWIDAETLGLDPARDALLELSVAEAELESPFDHGPIRHWVIEWRGRTESLSPAVRAMHSESGLFGECAVSSLSAGDVEEVLLSVVPEVDAYEDRPTLAGSSVHFDHGFLAAKMPRLASRLSHRHYDVSAVKLFCRSLGMPKLPRAEAHRASADLVESVEHARLCAE